MSHITLKRSVPRGQALIKLIIFKAVLAASLVAQMVENPQDVLTWNCILWFSVFLKFFALSVWWRGMGRIPAHFGATALIQPLGANSLSHHCFGTIIANIITVGKKQMISNAIMKTVLTPQTSPQNGLGEPQVFTFWKPTYPGQIYIDKTYI